METNIILIKNRHYYFNSFDLLFIINSYSFKIMKAIGKY